MLLLLEAHHSRAVSPQLLAYAVGVRSFMVENLHQVAVNRDVVEKFYPLLADLILEVRMAPCAWFSSRPLPDITSISRPSCATATTKLRRCARHRSCFGRAFRSL